MKDTFVKFRCNKEEKILWQAEAIRSKLSLSAWIRTKLADLVIIPKFEISPNIQTSNYNRPWEVKETDFQVITKGERKLPLIPGTPQWKAHQFYEDKLSVMSELKLMLQERRKRLEEELLADEVILS